jgi:saposin
VEEPTVNSVECSLCKFVVQYVDKAIGNNRTEAAIEAALEKVCTILPHALNSSCVQFVETFGPSLLQLLEKYGTPDLVCDAIKLCKNGTEELTLRKYPF